MAVIAPLALLLLGASVCLHTCWYRLNNHTTATLLVQKTAEQATVLVPTHFNARDGAVWCCSALLWTADRSDGRPTNDGAGLLSLVTTAPALTLAQACGGGRRRCRGHVHRGANRLVVNGSFAVQGHAAGEEFARHARGAVRVVRRERAWP